MKSPFLFKLIFSGGYIYRERDIQIKAKIRDIIRLKNIGDKLLSIEEKRKKLNIQRNLPVSDLRY